MKRLLSLATSIVLVTGLLCIPAGALADERDRSSVEAAVEQYLQTYTQSTLMNEDSSLSVNTVSGVVVPLTRAENATYALSSGTATLPEMQENISYIEEKAEFFKEARQAQGITRTDLELSYDFEDVTVAGNTATATVSELASFYYTGETQQSFAETIYTVDLVNVDGEWLIADVNDNDWFDATYKDAQSSFNAEAALADMEAAQAMDNGCVVQLLDDEPELMTTASYRIPYNADSATAYAYTYTRQTGTESWQDYYNQDFVDFRADGGDCMNFASQCMWAGFSGNQTRASIDAHNIPMDKDGSSSTTWYSCSKDKYSSRVANSTGSWRSCSAFRTYMGNTNNATDIGLKCNTADVAAGANFSGVTTSALKGAVCHVDGGGGAYTHAIVLTDINGLSRSQIYLCAHYTDRKYVKLGDYYPSCAIKAFMPQYFRTNVPLTNYLQVDMVRPVKRNNSAALKCYTTGAQNKFTIAVTSPSGKTSQASSTASNPKSFTYNYKFTENGLYKVDCYSKPTASSAATVVTYYVLCYTL